MEPQRVLGGIKEKVTKSWVTVGDPQVCLGGHSLWRLDPSHRRFVTVYENSALPMYFKYALGLPATAHIPLITLVEESGIPARTFLSLLVSHRCQHSSLPALGVSAAGGAVGPVSRGQLHKLHVT